jgi:hypothetical protein
MTEGCTDSKLINSVFHTAPGSSKKTKTRRAYISKSFYATVELCVISRMRRERVKYKDVEQIEESGVGEQGFNPEIIVYSK